MAAALALFSLSCAQTIHSQVSSFTELPKRPSGLTYAIVPLREQRSSSAFKQYEQRVRAHLEAHGFVPEAFDKAEYVVAMAYAVDDDGEVMASYPIIGQSGSSSSRMSGTTQAYTNTTSYSATTGYTPFFQASAQARDEADSGKSDTQRVLRLDIVRKESIGRGRIQKVYEGEVLSEGSSGALPEIVPAMIEALFKSFPGEDGAVRHVASKSVPAIDEIDGKTDESLPGDLQPQLLGER